MHISFPFITQPHYWISSLLRLLKNDYQWAHLGLKRSKLWKLVQMHAKAVIHYRGKEKKKTQRKMASGNGQIYTSKKLK